MFLIVATYAVCFAAFAHDGWSSLPLAAVFGTLGSIVIVLTSKTSLSFVLLTGVGGILGAFVGSTCLGDIILSTVYGYDHGFGETAWSVFVGSAIGAVCGCLGGARLARQMKHKPIDNNGTTDSQQTSE